VEVKTELPQEAPVNKKCIETGHLQIFLGIKKI